MRKACIVGHLSGTTIAMPPSSPSLAEHTESQCYMIFPLASLGRLARCRAQALLFRAEQQGQGLHKLRVLQLIHVPLQGLACSAHTNRNTSAIIADHAATAFSPSRRAG